MNANLTKFRDRFNLNHRKEKHFISELSAFTIVDGKINELGVLRVYGTRAANYVCLWIFTPDRHLTASGRATGYGYHRPSEAMEIACENSGIELSEPIGGRGDASMQEAFVAICSAAHNVEKHNIFVHKAHA